jgi:hypothetical protein
MSSNVERVRNKALPSREFSIEQLLRSTRKLGSINHRYCLHVLACFIQRRDSLTDQCMTRETAVTGAAALDKYVNRAADRRQRAHG